MRMLNLLEMIPVYGLIAAKATAEMPIVICI